VGIREDLKLPTAFELRARLLRTKAELEASSAMRRLPATGGRYLHLPLRIALEQHCLLPALVLGVPPLGMQEPHCCSAVRYVPEQHADGASFGGL
jgi:hypothetical protein